MSKLCCVACCPGQLVGVFFMSPLVLCQVWINIPDTKKPPEGGFFEPE